MDDNIIDGRDIRDRIDELEALDPDRGRGAELTDLTAFLDEAMQYNSDADEGGPSPSPISWTTSKKLSTTVTPFRGTDLWRMAVPSYDDQLRSRCGGSKGRLRRTDFPRSQLLHSGVLTWAT